MKKKGLNLKYWGNGLRPWLTNLLGLPRAELVRRYINKTQKLHDR